jgi:hypothetical protein
MHRLVLAYREIGCNLNWYVPYLKTADQCVCSGFDDSGAADADGAAAAPPSAGLCDASGPTDTLESEKVD